MDENLVQEISNTTGVPQMLVSRSAQARAEANGTDVNTVLSSWSSGTPTEVVAAPVVEETVVAAPVVEETVVAAPVVEETVIVTPLVEEVIEPPADLFSKIARAVQYGSLFGLVAGFIQAIVISTYLYDGLVLESETFNLIANYE